MWGNFSYLILNLMFAGTVAFVALVFGYHFYKSHFKTIGKLLLLALVLTPLEKVALLTKAWEYNPEKNLGVLFSGIPLESFIYSFLCFLAISLPVYIWTFYEDRGKPIIQTSLKDIFRGTYAIWKKNKEP